MWQLGKKPPFCVRAICAIDWFFFLTDLLLPNILLSSTEFLRRRFLRNVRRSKKMFQLFRVWIVCYVRYVLLLSYTTIDMSHNAFLCLCTIEITKIILPISINFNWCICINGQSLRHHVRIPAWRDPNLIACAASWPYYLVARRAGSTFGNVKDAAAICNCTPYAICAGTFLKSIISR